MRVTTRLEERENRFSPKTRRHLSGVLGDVTNNLQRQDKSVMADAAARKSSRIRKPAPKVANSAAAPLKSAQPASKEESPSLAPSGRRPSRKEKENPALAGEKVADEPAQRRSSRKEKTPGGEESVRIEVPGAEDHDGSQKTAPAPPKRSSGRRALPSSTKSVAVEKSGKIDDKTKIPPDEEEGTSTKIQVPVKRSTSRRVNPAATSQKTKSTAKTSTADDPEKTTSVKRSSTRSASKTVKNSAEGQVSAANSTSETTPIVPAPTAIDKCGDRPPSQPAPPAKVRRSTRSSTKGPVETATEPVAVAEPAVEPVAVRKSSRQSAKETPPAAEEAVEKGEPVAAESPAVRGRRSWRKTAPAKNAAEVSEATSKVNSSTSEAVADRSSRRSSRKSAVVPAVRPAGLPVWKRPQAAAAEQVEGGPDVYDFVADGSEQPSKKVKRKRAPRKKTVAGAGRQRRKVDAAPPPAVNPRPVPNGDACGSQKVAEASAAMVRVLAESHDEMAARPAHDDDDQHQLASLHEILADPQPEVVPEVEREPVGHVSATSLDAGSVVDVVVEPPPADAWHRERLEETVGAAPAASAAAARIEPASILDDWQVDEVEEATLADDWIVPAAVSNRRAVPSFDVSLASSTFVESTPLKASRRQRPVLGSPVAPPPSAALPARLPLYRKKQTTLTSMVRPLAESASLSGRKTPTASSSSSSPPADQENRPKPVVATPPTVFAHPARRSYTKGHLRAAQRRMFQDLDDVELDHQHDTEEEAQVEPEVKKKKRPAGAGRRPRATKKEQEVERWAQLMASHFDDVDKFHLSFE